jgi:N-acetylglucosaminyldiphosphoundecaprenol N-acetyl-beta-D-mannosaminyltransferase
MNNLENRRILGVRVDATDCASGARQIIEWAGQRRSRYVCFATASAIMECYDSGEYREVFEQADLVTSDGMPLVWVLRLLGVRDATRVYGPDLTPLVLEAAAAAGIPVGFHGGTETTLRRLVDLMIARYPELKVAYAKSPPFRLPTRDEDECATRQINHAGVRILFVGLGSPKQDLWMSAHAGRIDAVMLGVGAAFDFLAGTKPQAPQWMQRNGLEWIFRFMTEPKRLWRRYLRHNPRFLVLALAQLFRTRLNEHRRAA